MDKRWRDGMGKDDYLRMKVCERFIMIDELEEVLDKEPILPKCLVCSDKGFYTIGGSFGGSSENIRCHCQELCKCEKSTGVIELGKGNIVCKICKKKIHT
ncbi:MAG: hypothetical protein Q7R95_05880 [bacterium]|nr:hypothetical protein [bacterium]